MKWPNRLIIILDVFLAVIGLQFLIPLNTNIPEIEKRAGEKLYESAKISSLGILLVPLLHLRLQQV